jgi:hypothetical protein
VNRIVDLLSRLRTDEGFMVTAPFFLGIRAFSEFRETGPDGTLAQANRTEIPLVTNGRVPPSREAVHFVFKASKG